MKHQDATLIVAAPTPFMADGALDAAGLRHNIGMWLDAGVDGILVLGSTGEAIHLDDDESAEVVAVARRAVPAGKILVTGTARPTTAGTIRWTARAAALGADLALVLTPHYYRTEMTAAVLERYYRAVADASPVPIVLYSMPGLTGVTLPPSVGAALASHPRVAGTKDSSGDVAALFERIELSGADHRIFSGSARAVFPALATGAAGCILAIASVAPEMAVDVHRAFRDGDVNRARQTAHRLAVLSARLAPYGLGGLKAAMTVRGFRGGICRPPLAFEFSGMRDIESALAEAGLAERAAVQ